MSRVLSGPSLAGPPALLGAVALFSTVELASKAIQVTYAARLEPFLLVFIRFFLTAVCLLAVGVPGARRRGLVLRGRDYAVLALNGLIGIALSISLFHMAILAFRNASSSAVVFSANPVFVALLAPLVNRETIGLRKAGAVALGSLGVLCFAFESGRLDRSSSTGLMAMVCSAVLFALGICLSRRIIPRYGPLLTMGLSSLFASLAVLPLGLWRSQVPILPELAKGLLPVLYVAVVGTALAYGLYYYGLARTSACTASLAFFLKPVLATGLAVAVAGERLNLYTAGGTGLVLVGLLLALLGDRFRPRPVAGAEAPR
jgi:drug/metabolite transporter (DMT)-like permease